MIKIGQTAMFYSQEILKKKGGPTYIVAYNLTRTPLLINHAYILNIYKWY